MLGPAVAGLLASTIMGEILPVIMAAVISFLALLVINFRLKESHPCIVDTDASLFKGFKQFFQVEPKPCYTEGEVEMKNESNQGWKFILKISGVPSLFAIYFLTFLAFSFFYAGWPVYVSTQLSWTSIDLGIFLAYFSLVMVVVQGPVLQRLSKRLSSTRLLIAGSVILGIGFIFLSGKQVIMLYGAVTLMALGNGIMWPSFMAILSTTGTAKMQGRIQGYGSSMGSIGSIMGLILGGILIQSWGNSLFIIGALIFFVIALIMAIANGKPYVRVATSDALVKPLA